MTTSDSGQLTPLWTLEYMIARAEGIAADHRLGIDNSRMFRLSRDILRFVRDARQQDAQRIELLTIQRDDLGKQYETYLAIHKIMSEDMNTAQQHIAELETERLQLGQRVLDENWKVVEANQRILGNTDMEDIAEAEVTLPDNIRLCRRVTQEAEHVER